MEKDLTLCREKRGRAVGGLLTGRAMKSTTAAETFEGDGMEASQTRVPSITLHALKNFPEEERVATSGNAGNREKSYEGKKSTV